MLSSNIKKNNVCAQTLRSVTSSYTVSHHHTQCHIIIRNVTSSYSVISSYAVSHHHTQCHKQSTITLAYRPQCNIIIHNFTSSFAVSHHHTQCHIIIRSVTSSYTVPQTKHNNTCLLTVPPTRTRHGPDTYSTTPRATEATACINCGAGKYSTPST